MGGFEAAHLMAPAGLLVGAGLGFVARRAHFCTLNAFERLWYAGDSIGIRTWALAAATAAAITQALVFTGAISLVGSFYLAPALPLTGAIIGGIAFGFGMALVGTCGFGALVRLGGGSLKAFVALIVLGLSALAAQRGLVAQARLHLVDELAIDLGFAGDQSAGRFVSALAGADLRLVTAVAIIGGGLAWIFSSPAMRANRRAIFTGVAIGALVAAGWAITCWGARNAFVPVQIEAGSFVVPVGDTLMQVATYTGVLPDYGVGLVIGVVLGAGLAAWRQRDVRWEACDDARELGRHLAGAALMGVGGVFAFGCTIGQGISAASTLALSVPFVMLSMAFGARLGLAWLMEGSFRPAFGLRS
ncbi:MAG: YeeE/YedE family protein [Flavobacteriaceae bacterium]